MQPEDLLVAEPFDLEMVAIAAVRLSLHVLAPELAEISLEIGMGYNGFERLRVALGFAAR